MSRNGDGGHRAALPTQGAQGACLGLKSCCSFWYALRYATPLHLRSTSWKNRAIVRLESVQEQAQPAKVSIYVDHNHPLLQLKRALPWEALFEVMTRHWRQAGKNTDGRPGLPWDVALYVPLVVLMVVKHLNAREMEAYVAENVVARVFIGRQDAPRPQIRDHSNIARAYAALGKDGVEEINR